MITDSYSIIIDTDKYSGNFERELCAYVTGVIGECGVGGAQASQYKLSGLTPLDNIVRQMPDDHGCFRPVAICPSPGYFNNGMGYHYKPTTNGKRAALERYRRAVIDTCTPYLNQFKKRIEEKDFVGRLTLDTCKGEIERYSKRISEAQDMKDPYAYPAYQSVEIFFSEIPPKETILTIESRAREYCAQNKIKVLDIRYIKKKEVIEDAKRFFNV